MSRTIENSGGLEHVELVKLASKRIIDSFIGLKNISINYEEENITVDITLDEKENSWHRIIFTLRPDIIVLRVSKEFRRYTNSWLSIQDSRFIIFEIETNPQNIFANMIKMESYKQLRKERGSYAFVLVVWSDAQLPEKIEPFDEVWKFEKDKEALS